MELNHRLSSLWSKIIACPLRYPVETVGALWLFVTLVWVTKLEAHNLPDPSLLQHLISAAYFVVPVMTLSMRLRQAGHRLLYWLTLAIVVGLACWGLDFDQHGAAVVVAYLLGLLLLLYKGESCDNADFAAHLLRTGIRLAFAGLCGLLVMLAWLAIVNSIGYIFSLYISDFIRMLGIFFSWTIVATLCFVMLYDEPAESLQLPERVLHVALDYIISPAVIIYAVILYVYAAQILFTWNLPKGGVAYMVMGFLGVSLLARMLQEPLPKKRYAWFYDNLTWIAIAPLILFFVGLLTRIEHYSFTQSRVYLLFAGLVMVGLMLLLVRRPRRSYALMPGIVGVTLIVITYIPGISAKAIGIHSQGKRLEKFISELKLNDARTGKLKEKIDLETINKSDALSRKFNEVCNIAFYLQRQMGKEQFTATYGNWPYGPYNWIEPDPIEQDFTTLSRSGNIDLGPYTLMLDPDSVKFDLPEDKEVLVKIDQRVVLQSNLTERLRKGEKPESLFITKDGQYMLVLQQIEVNAAKKEVRILNTYNAMVFRKP